MKNAFKIGLSVWFGALLLQGCNVYSEDLLLTSETSSLDDDLSDGKWWHTTVPCPRDDLGASLQCGPTKEGCESEGMPKPGDRMPSDAAAGDVPTFYFGITQLRVGNVADAPGTPVDSDAWKTIGFDVDGACTRSATCTLADGVTPVNQASCTTGVVNPADGDGCRDNTVGQLFKIASSQDSLRMFGFNEPRWNCALHNGWLNIISKVTNYNGKANDDSIRIDLYSSVGTGTANFDCDAHSPDYGTAEGWHEQAIWTPTIPWQVTKRSIDPAVNPEDFGDHLPDALVADANAYVRNGWVVATLPAGSELWLNDEKAPFTAGMRLIIHRGTFAARLEKDQLSDTWVVTEGTIAGAVLGTDALESFHELGFCENFCGNYSLFQNYLTTYGDLSAAPGEPDPSAPCDAMSLAIAFKGQQAMARRQDIVEVTPPTTCPEPKHPDAPPHGCVCQGTKCIPPETGGAGGSAGTGGAAGGGGSAGTGGAAGGGSSAGTGGSAGTSGSAGTGGA